MKIKLCIYWYKLKVKVHKFLVNHTKIPVCHGFWGPCFRRGKKRRQNTAYADDKMNWVFLCDGCSADNDERWKEEWDAYYAGLL